MLPRPPQSPKVSRREQSGKLRLSSLCALCVLFLALSSSLLALSSPRFAEVRKAPLSFSSYRQVFASRSARTMSPAPFAGVTYFSQGSLDPTLTTSWNTLPGGGGANPPNFTGGDIFTIQNGHNMTNTAGAWTISGSGSQLIIATGGTLTANNAVNLASATFLQIQAGGAYVHNNTSGIASTILNGNTELIDAASNFTIANCNSSGPSSGSISSGSFGNLIINAPTLATAVNSAGALTSIAGDFKIQNTNGQDFRLSTNSAFTLTIGGNLEISGGTLNISNGTGTAASMVVNIGGNFNQTGGVFTSSGTTQIPTVAFSGGSSSATFTQSAGTFTNTRINWSVASGKTVQFNNTFSLPAVRTFTIASGGTLVQTALFLNSGAITVDGELRVGPGGNPNGNSYSYGASSTLSYAGTSAQTSTNTEFPLASGPPNLTINNGAGFTLHAARTISGTVTLTSGAVSNAGNLTLGNGATISRVTGSLSGTPTFGTTVNVTYTGSSGVTTGTEIPSSSSILNALTVNNTGGVTLGSNATVNGASSIGSGATLNTGAFALTVSNTLTNSGTFNVSSGGTLKGTGTVSGPTNVQSGGTVAPGNSAGILNSGNVTFTSGSIFNPEIGGTTVGTQYDQLNVTGTVTLGSATLTLTQINSFVPASGDTFTVINNDSSDAVSGTFSGLPEGASISNLLGASGINGIISYVGGSGNDVVITAVAVSSGDVAVGIAGTNIAKLKGTDGTVSWNVPVANDSALALDQSDFGVYTGKGGAGSGTGATYKYTAAGTLAWTNTVTTGSGFCSFYYVNGAAVDTTSGTPGVVFTEGSCGGAMAKANRTTGAQIWSFNTNDIGRPSIDPANGQIYASTYLGPFNTLYSVTTGGSASTASLCQGVTDLNPADGMLYLGGNMGVGGCGLQLKQLNKSALGTPNWTMSLAGVVTSFDTMAVQPWSGGYIYVGSNNDSKIVVIDPATQTVAKVFTTAVPPGSIAVNPNGGTIYVGWSASGFNNVYAYSPQGALLWTSPNLGGPIYALASPRNLVGTAPAAGSKYRSRTTGDWNDFNTWDIDTGSGFVPATSGQTPTSADDTIVIQSGHTVTVTANVSVDQVTVNSGGVLTINGGVTVTVDDGYFDDVIVAGTLNANGILAGAGSVGVTSGTATLSNNNTFTGGVNVSSGTVNLNNAGALGTGTFTINGGTVDNTSGGALTLTNSATRIVNANFTFTGSNNLNLGTAGVSLGTAAGTSRTVTVSAGTLTVGGVIANGTTANALTKAGGGTLTLTGANTYSGATTINAGTLTLSGTGSLASSTLTTAGGATFDVSSHTGTVTLSTSQTLNGTGTASSGTINGNLTMGSTSPLTLSYAGANPTLTVSNGALTLAAGNPVTVTTTSALAAGDYVLISKSSGGSVAGTAPTGVTVGGSGLAANTTAALRITGQQLILQVRNLSGDIGVDIAGTTILKLNGTDGTVAWSVAQTNDGALAVDQSDFGVYTGNGGHGSGTGATYKYTAAGTLAWTNTVTTGSGFCSFYYVNGAAVDTTSGTPGVVFTEGSCGGAMAKANRTTGAQIWSFNTNDIGRPSIDPANGQIYASTYLGPFNTLYSVTTGGSASSASLCQGVTDLNPADGMLYLGGNMGTGGCGLQLKQLNKSALGTPNWTMSLAGVVTSFDTMAVQPWSGGYIYVGSVSSSKIVVIDPATQSVVRTFTPLVAPVYLAANPNGTLYIANGANNFTYAYSPTGTLLWTSSNLGGVVNGLATPRNLVGTAPAVVRYRSVTSGNWNAASTWESSTDGGSSWFAAADVPAADSDPIEIQTGHTVTVTADTYADQLTVDLGATLIINSGVTLTINNGPGTDFNNIGTTTVNGTLINNGLITNSSPFNANGTFQINNGGSFGGNTPVYGGSSTLVYNTPSGHTVGNEWTGNASTAGAGTPQNVTVQAGPSGTVQLPSTDRALAGNLTIISGTLALSTTANITLTVNGNLTLTAGSVTVGTAILTLNGDTSVASGTLSAASGTVNYFGSGTQHVIATDYFLLAFASGSKILPSSGTVGILDTFNPGGTSGHTITGSTIDFKKATNQSIPAFQYNNLSNSGNGARTYANGGTVQIAGTFSYGNGGPHTVTGNTIELNGTSAQTLPNQGFTFNNLTINNAAGVTAGTTGSPVNVNGTLALANGALNNGVGNNLTLANGATINRSGGTIANAPIFGTSVNLIYSGAAAVNSGPEIPSSTTVLNNLTMNKSGGVTLTANAQANGVLTLTSGIVTTTDSFTLTLGGSASSTGASTSSYVKGNLKKIYSSTGSFTFDVGDAGYSPVTVDAAAGTGNVTAKATHGFSLSNANNNVLERFWDLTNSGITLANLTFQWLATDVHGAEATYVAFKSDGGTATVVPASVNTGTHTGTVLAQTSFSTWTFGEPSAPTAVKLTKWAAESFNDGVQLSWESGFEVDNLGYQIYRERSGQRERVTQGIVAGSALKVGPRSQLRAGYAYSWFDSEGTPETAYYLEAIDLNGSRELIGPIYPARGFGESPNTRRDRARLLGEPVSSEALDASDASRFERTWPASTNKSLNGNANEASDDTPTSPQPPAAQSSLPSSRAVKISVTRAGWYRVTQPELVAAGLDANADPRRLQLFVGGEEIPIIVNANGNRLEAGDSIEFYGQSLDTLSTGTQVYWLINGASNGKRINRPKAPKPSNQDWTNLLGGSFNMTVARQDKLIYFSSLLNGDATNIFGPVITSYGAATQNLTVNNLDASSTQAQLSVTLQGATEVDHQVQIEVNGTPVGVVNFTGRAHPTQTFTVSRALLHEGANVVQLSATGGDTDVSLVDSVSLTYAHSYRADSNALRFSVPAGRTIVVNGFSSSSLRVIDVTNPNTPSDVAPQISSMNGGYAFKLQTTSTGGTRTFMAFTDDLAAHPSALTANQPSSLTTMAAADMLIVTHKNFRAAIEPLAAQRRSEGLTVSVVDIEDVYDEFSFGTHTPNALRDFLAWTNTHWAHAPRYLLLVGDSSWDPKDSLGQGFSDFVPTKLIDTVYLETASDDWLTDFDGDGVADVATGRLPARTAAEATLMVNKILGYEHERQTGSPLRGALMVADSGFESESSTTAALLPSSIAVTTINRADVGSDDLTRTQIVNNLNTGPLVANYFGHGSVTVWTGAGLLDSDLATNLNNNNRPTLFVLMTCLNGYSHDAYIDSLGESLLKAPQGGAMAVWASSGFTESDPQFVMSSQFYRQLFSATTVRLGDGFKPAKLTIADPDVKRTWLLLGDPSMRIR